MQSGGPGLSEPDRAASAAPHVPASDITGATLAPSRSAAPRPVPSRRRWTVSMTGADVPLVHFLLEAQAGVLPARVAGVISPDNDARAPKNAWHPHKQAKVPRDRIVHWNVVP